MLKVVKFSAEWCGPCKALAPVFDKIEASTAGVDFAKIDIDEDPALAQSMGVMAVPTIVFVKNGGVVDVIVGLQKESVIRNTIEKWK